MHVYSVLFIKFFEKLMDIQQQLDALKQEIEVLKNLNVVNYTIFLRGLRLFSKIQILKANGFSVPDANIVPYTEFLKKLNIQSYQFWLRINNTEIIGNTKSLEMSKLTLVQLKELFSPEHEQEWIVFKPPDFSDPKNMSVLRVCVERMGSEFDVQLFNIFILNKI